MRLNRFAALRAQEGFTMALVMGVLTVASLLGLAAYAAAQGDIGTTGQSRDRKQAYAAAEAGVNYYLSRLTSDNAYWAKCTNVPAVAAGQPAPINPRWNGTGTDPRIRRTLPNSGAQYTIELLPAPGQTQCDPSNADLTMINPGTGTFRIRATGFVRRGIWDAQRPNPAVPNGDPNDAKRSIVASFRRTKFLDFLWFTDFETTDPLAYPASQVSAANTYCANRYRAARPSGCLDIQFAGFDRINGPLHTNDDLLLCGSPTFGRTRSDRVEVSGPLPGYKQAGGCSGTPSFLGTFAARVDSLRLPATNAALAATALPSYTFTGQTSIVLRADGTMDVTTGSTPTTTNLAWPTNGLVYVQSGSCGSSTPPVAQTYTDDAGCANVSVQGTYARDLTIASAKDVVVNGDVVKASGSDALLGLIADNFVRIWHPVNRSDCTLNLSPLQTVRIDAALLALQHSFTVDNYDCGAGLQDLTVNGAIAQKYRGAVGQAGSGTSYTGYKKNYNYDDRLRYRNPPYFLDPVAAAWHLQRVNEQVPAR
jgi:Tfp pilus assembly protein PilX